MSEPTARELEVLAACLHHGSQKLAAQELGIGLQTVKSHLRTLYLRLDVDRASQAAEALGWLSLPNASGRVSMAAARSYPQEP